MEFSIYELATATIEPAQPAAGLAARAHRAYAVWEADRLEAAAAASILRRYEAAEALLTLVNDTLGVERVIDHNDIRFDDDDNAVVVIEDLPFRALPGAGLEVRLPCRACGRPVWASASTLADLGRALARPGLCPLC